MFCEADQCRIWWIPLFLVIMLRLYLGLYIDASVLSIVLNNFRYWGRLKLLRDYLFLLRSLMQAFLQQSEKSLSAIFLYDNSWILSQDFA